MSVRINEKEEKQIEEEEETLINKNGIDYSIKFKQNQESKDIIFLFDYYQNLFSKLFKINDFF